MEAVIAFIAEHIIAIVFAIISAGALAYAKHFHKEVKNYKSMIRQQEKDAFMEEIDNKIEPIQHELEELRTYIRDVGAVEKSHMDLIVSSYRFRLVQLCKQFIKQGYIYPDQQDQLVEFYKLYRALGGNGQAKEYYETAMKLEVKYQ